MSDLDTASKRTRLTHQLHEGQNDTVAEQNISSESQTTASFQNPNRECALYHSLCSVKKTIYSYYRFRYHFNANYGTILRRRLSSELTAKKSGIEQQCRIFLYGSMSIISNERLE